MKYSSLKYLLFTLVFLFTFLWLPIFLLLGSFKQDKQPFTVIEDKQIQQLITDKTGLNIRKIKIAESDNLYGMMIGIPGKPQLILSRNLYHSFNTDEVEYVVLHEVGHYQLWHSLIEFVAGSILFVAGLLLLKKINKVKLSILCSLILGLILGILMVRLGHCHELQADSFAVKKITNPAGMIEATKKFQNYPGIKYSVNKNKIIQFLFYRSNPYDNRIKIALHEIERRITNK